MTVPSTLRFFGLDLIHLTYFRAFVVSVGTWSIFRVFRAKVIKFKFECRATTQPCSHHGTTLAVKLHLVLLFTAISNSNFKVP